MPANFAAITYPTPPKIEMEKKQNEKIVKQKNEEKRKKEMEKKDEQFVD